MTRKTIKHHFTALAAYLGVTLLFTYPLALKFSTHVPGDGKDGYVFFWNLWWVKRALVTLKTSPLFCNYIFYPEGTSLGLHTHTIFNGLISIPLQFIFGLPAVYNIIVIFSFLFSAYGTYLLADYLVKDRPAAFIAGIIFAFCPYKFAHLLGHMNLVSSEWIPFYILYLIKTTENRFTVRYSLLAGLFMFLTALCSYYYATFLAIFTLFYWAYLKFADKKLELDRYFFGKAAIMCAVPAIGLLPVFFSIYKDFVYGNYAFSGTKLFSVYVSDLLGFFTPSYFHPVLGKLVRNAYEVHFSGGPSESDVFVGYTVIILVIYSLFKFRSRSREFRFWLYCAAFFFLLSLGPVLHVYGKSYPVFLPAWFLRWIPVFKGVRSYCRLVVIAMLSLSVYSAYACSLIFRGSRRRHLTMLFLVFLIFFEYAPLPYPLCQMSSMPGIYDGIAKEKDDFSILEIPLGWGVASVYLGQPDIRQQFWQTRHNKRLINGIVARGISSQADYLLEMPLIGRLLYLQETGKPRELLRTASDRESVNETIDYLGVRYIVIHPPYIGTRVHKYIAGEMPVKLEKVYEGDDAVAYRVIADKCRQNGKKRRNYVQYRYGWSGVEQWDSEIYMHWSNSKRSTLSVILDSPADHELKMRLLPFPYETTEQGIKIYVNDKFLDGMKLDRDWKEYSFFAPAAFWKKGVNTISLSYKFVSTPADVYRNTEDRRTLAAGVDYFRVD